MASSAGIAVVTDSAAGLPKSLLTRYNITVVPYWMHMGRDAYLSGATIDPATFFSRIRADPELEVHTGVQAIARLVEIYTELAGWAKGIVSVHLAGKQSGTCNAAEIAARESPIPVIFIDTETTAMAEGFVASAAARAAERGRNLELVAAAAREAVPNRRLLALLESVSYALRGGCLSAVAGKDGSLLRIQPLVRV